jgi:hypothetical protein
MSKPNAEELAKIIVWNLACMRAEIEQVNTKLEMLCEKHGLDIEPSPAMKETLNTIKQTVFLKTLRAVGIEPGEGWPPDES